MNQLSYAEITACNSVFTPGAERQRSHAATGFVGGNGCKGALVTSLWALLAHREIRKSLS